MSLQSIFNDLGNGTFEHEIEGVSRAIIPGSQLIAYIANLAPALFAATAASPQIDAVAAITKGVLSVSSDVLAAIQAGVTPPAPGAGTAATPAAVVPPPAPPAPPPPPSAQEQIAALEAQLAALKGASS